MITAHSARHHPWQGGVTLIELLLVLVIMSVGLVGLSGLYGTAFRALDTQDGLVDATQLAQACAEQVLDARHRVRTDSSAFDIAAFVAPACASAPSGFSVSGPTLGAVYTGTGTTLCPDGIRCRDLQVSVSHLASGTDAQVDWLLVEY